MDRRDFIRASAGAAALIGVESFSFRARAALTPTRARLGHLNLCDCDDKDPTLNKKILADLLDLLAKPAECETAEVTILTSGPLDSPEPVATPAFRLLVLGPSPTIVELHDLPLLLDWISKNGGGENAVILATALPLDIPRPAADRLGEAERQELLKILPNYPEFVLVLSGGGINRAAFLPRGPLSLCTAPALIYPCGGRSVDLEIGADGGIKIESRFLQSRFLADVENLYRKGVPDARNLKRLGGRADRQLVAVAGERKIEPVKFPATPNLAPWPANASRIDLAIVTDTHLVLDKFLDEREKKVFNLIGHSLESDSKALIADVLGQVAEGRHRVEFYDQVFSKDPQSDRHYLNRPVDGLLVLGDVTEKGKREEAEAFKGLLDGLPAKLRERTLLVPGNHDLKNFFSPDGMASDRHDFCKLFSDYGMSQGSSYMVELSEWCTVLMLDSVIATGSAMGFAQERIDWIEDQLERQRGKVVLVASHHDLYQLSLVPPALFAYLRSQSHFTGRKSAAREQLHRLFAKHNCVKLCLSGHYHSVVADEWKKGKGVGDRFTVHLQSPCVTEYPSGYRVLSLVRDGGSVKANYYTAYTRLWEIRQKSLDAFGYRIAGTKPRVPPLYEGTLKELQEQEGFFGDIGFLDPYDLIKLNVRGFKDGTGNAGRGNGRLRNIDDSVDFRL